MSSLGRKKRSVDVAEISKKTRIGVLIEALESLIITFVFVLVFIAFVMQTFIIPTGSMAKTLMGEHFRLRCSQCGYKYDHGFRPELYGMLSNTVPSGKVPVHLTRCPNCGFYQESGNMKSVANGDKIFVLKCVYQFSEPRRWDVIVFSYPVNPSVTYIKRLIGLPGEKIEIIDGDVYIDDKIARKPAAVQEDLWSPIYNNDFQPVDPASGSFNGHIWQQPFDVANSPWRIDPQSQTKFLLKSQSDQESWLKYDTRIGNDFRAINSYNRFDEGQFMQPFCSDLMVRFYAETSQSQGVIGAALGKYETLYKGWVDLAAGELVISKTFGGKEIELNREHFKASPPTGGAMFAFSNVDHMLTVNFGDEHIEYDLGLDVESAGPRRTKIEPKVSLFGLGELEYSHVAIYRDIYYTSDDDRARAVEGRPFTLGKAQQGGVDEFFPLGDNSSDSQDGRFWDSRGVGNNGRSFTAGVVPREYLLGKALVVVWPAGFKPVDRSPFAFIPNAGQMRFIQSGSGK